MLRFEFLFELTAEVANSRPWVRRRSANGAW
jgi:hypothetical protein